MQQIQEQQCIQNEIKCHQQNLKSKHFTNIGPNEIDSDENEVDENAEVHDNNAQLNDENVQFH